MMRSNLLARRLWKYLFVLMLTSLALALPTVTASGPAGQDGSPPAERKAPSAVYPGYERFDARTRATVLLPSQRYGLPAHVMRNAYRLDELDTAAIVPAAPNQVGINRRLDLTSREQGERFVNRDGSKVRRLTITAPGAKALRLRLEDFNLPEGDEVYVYGLTADSHIAGPYAGRGPFGDGSYWTDAIDGDTAVIEHYIARRETGFRVAEASHIYSDITAGEVSPQVLSCEVDATCFNDPEMNAVGRMLFQSGSSAFVCTGTMLNNNSGDFTPLFLTAAHCISTEDQARSLQVYWFYQTAACGSNMLSPNGASSAGAVLLGTSRTADSTLLKLTGAIPPGVVFAGWDANSSPTTSVFGLHHPGGGIPPSATSHLRKSIGNIYPASLACPASGLTTSYVVTWSTGITEPGSSGSGLFRNRSVIGVLSCGPSNVTCSNNFSLYGRLVDFYPAVQPFLELGSRFDNCVTSLSSEQQSFGTEGGAGTVGVNASPTCIWAATTNVSWIVLLNGSSGAGGKLMGFGVEKNTGPPRTGTITVQNKTLSIRQDGIVCTYTLSSPAQAISSAGGEGSLTVAAPGGCNWAPSSDVDWITITSPNSSGDGTLTFTVAANPTASARSGHITVGDQSVTVMQESGPGITGATVQGKQLIVTGVNFADGAALLMDGVKQKKTFNEPAGSTTTLVARKAGKTIARGQTVVLQVRNPDGKLSQEFRYTKP